MKSGKFQRQSKEKTVAFGVITRNMIKTSLLSAASRRGFQVGAPIASQDTAAKGGRLGNQTDPEASLQWEKIFRRKMITGEGRVDGP